jgi:DNA polymerase-3 subunit delta'
VSWLRVEIDCDLVQSIEYNAAMSFADFPEQEQVVQLLQRSLQRGRLAHAYLFTGGNLGELEVVAQTLAKTLNCQQPRRGESGNALDSCDRCLSCRKIDGALHPDVHWVRPESKLRIITIDQMRELMSEVHLKPTEARFKVAVIVAADRLNAAAANAFLKTLEEPPARSILILLSTEPQRMLETTLSRCMRLNFAGESGPRFDEAQSRWLASFSEAASGEQKSLLGRYRLLGTLVSRLAQIKAEIDKNLSARSPLERYEEVDPRLREKWEEELSAAIEAEYRRQRAELLAGLQWWLRDVWLRTLAAPADLLRFSELKGSVETVARRVSSKDALENLQVLEKTQRLLYTNVQEALALEVGLLKLKL